MTDGEVSNVEECINTVRMHANTTRVFTFGIGDVREKNLFDIKFDNLIILIINKSRKLQNHW